MATKQANLRFLQARNALLGTRHSGKRRAIALEFIAARAALGDDAPPMTADERTLLEALQADRATLRRADATEARKVSKPAARPVGSKKTPARPVKAAARGADEEPKPETDEGVVRWRDCANCRALFVDLKHKKCPFCGADKSDKDRLYFAPAGDEVEGTVPKPLDAGKPPAAPPAATSKPTAVAPVSEPVAPQINRAEIEALLDRPSEAELERRAATVKQELRAKLKTWAADWMAKQPANVKILPRGDLARLMAREMPGELALFERSRERLAMRFIPE